MNEKERKSDELLKYSTRLNVFKGSNMRRATPSPQLYTTILGTLDRRLAYNSLQVSVLGLY